MIHEMKRALGKVTDSDKAWKQINYFTNNQERMDYPLYRAAGWPIGSGLVVMRTEGGLRWNIAA